VSPSWAGCAEELADVAVLLVRVALVRFDALVDGGIAIRPKVGRTGAHKGIGLHPDVDLTGGRSVDESDPCSPTIPT
jgi:hypothetical protein